MDALVLWGMVMYLHARLHGKGRHTYVHTAVKIPCTVCVSNRIPAFLGHASHGSQVGDLDRLITDTSLKLGEGEGGIAASNNFGNAAN